jgi:hypothetical protein
MVRKKITIEKYRKPEIVAEDLALLKLQEYNQTHFITAVYDLSLELNNPYFKAPFIRCPNCDKGSNAIMAYFGDGGDNKIGNLKGFQATIGDIIAWNSNSFKGLSVVKTRDNGIFGLETSHFEVSRKEPAVIEKMIVPDKYRSLLGEMATFLANKDNVVFKDAKLVRIGESEYPIAIKEQL